MKKLILASASPRRNQLLMQAGLTCEIVPSQAEEIITKNDPREVVKELSYLKAHEVANRFSDDSDVVIIGADTIVSYNGRIMGKPADKDDAISMLQILQGETHQVYTGVTMIVLQEGTKKIETFYEKTDVEFFPMTSAEIESYVETDEPMDKAGAYGIQGKSAVFIRRINGDYNNVVGLPIGRLYQELKKIDREISVRRYTHV